MLHRLLPVGGRVADVFLVWMRDQRKSLGQRRDDLRGVVHGQRRLRDVGEIGRVGRRQPFDILDGLHQRDGAWWKLSDRADDFWVPVMTDEKNMAAASMMDLGLAMHLGHERAGRIDRQQVSHLRIGRYGLGHAMCGKHHRGGSVGYLAQLLHEDRALFLQALDHVFVVHDFVAHIDRCAVDSERLLDRVDGTHDTCAEPRGAQSRIWRRGLLVNSASFLSQIALLRARFKSMQQDVRRDLMRAGHTEIDHVE